MFKLRSFFRVINLLNIILIIFILLIASYVVFPQFNIKVNILPTSKKIVTPEQKEPTQSQIPSPTDYMIIAEQNLFHPDRKIPPEKKEEQAMSKPEFVLYGTLMSDNTNYAYLEDLKAPRSTPGRGRRQTALKKGDTMSGYTLNDIEQDKVVMARGDDRIVLYVIDKHKPKRETSPLITQAAPRQPTAAPTRPRSASTQQKAPKPQPILTPTRPLPPADQKVLNYLQKRSR
jgi:hypothetical protein